MKISVSDPVLLRDLLGAIGVIVDEPTFKVTDVGLRVKSMDPSRVAMVDCEIPKEFFDVYEIGKAEGFCLSSTNLLKLLKRADKETKQATLESVVSKTQQIALDMTGDKYRRRFVLGLLDYDHNQDAPTPKVSWDAHATLTAESFVEAIADVSLASNYTTITLEPSRVLFSGKGDYLSADAELVKGNDAMLALECGEKQVSSFPLSYLTDIAKAAQKISELVTVYVLNDMPVKLDYKLTTGSLAYYLAPRIEIE